MSCVIFCYWLYLHVIFISIYGLILTSGIRARLFFQLSSAGKSHGQVRVMEDEGKLRVDRFNGQKF